MTYKNVLFELSGKSLEAAKRLEAKIVSELETVSVQNEGYLGDIDRSWTTFYEGLIERLTKEDPELLKQTGLSSPAIQVFKGKGTFPRAYREHPQIFLSPKCPKNPIV